MEVKGGDFGSSSSSSSSSSSFSASESSRDGASPSDKQEIFKLEKESELRMEVDPSTKENKVTIKVLKGTAEIFGTPLAENREYPISNFKFAIFTWHGCEILVKGTPAVAYVGSDTPMHSYVKSHGALEKMRAEAKQSKSNGPRAMVVGPTDAGKSSLCRLLLTYAVRRGWKPTFVDLDVGQNGIAIPGCIAATPVEHPVGSVNLANLQVRAPLAYYFGHHTPSASLPAYEKLAEHLAKSVDQRCAENLDAKYSGVIINTCGWTDGKGFDLIVHCANVFKVDVILVVGQERLCNALMNSKDARLEKVAVANLVKSAGVVQRDPSVRAAFRSNAIREYFYGFNGNLCPQKKLIPFNSVSIFQCGGGPVVPSTVLPIGHKSLLDPSKMTPVIPSNDLLHTVLAVSYAPDSASVMEHNVAGFIYVQEVDMQKKTMTCLVPTGGPLPGTTKSGTRLISGSIKWFDS